MSLFFSLNAQYLAGKPFELSNKNYNYDNPVLFWTRFRLFRVSESIWKFLPKALILSGRLNFYVTDICRGKNKMRLLKKNYFNYYVLHYKEKKNLVTINFLLLV